MLSPTFTPGSAADADELLPLWQRAVEVTHHFLASADIARLESLIRDVYLGAVTLTVARLDSVAAGFIGTTQGEDATVLSVEMLFVDPVWHGQGLGTALLERVAQGHETIVVDVNEQNPSALSFYEARGFSQVGRSETDGEGAPFPLLHLSRTQTPA